MQASFSHVGTGGARKTPPLSLGTWPTEGEGYEEALSWYDKVQRTLEPLRGKVGSDDERVQKIKLRCQQAAKAASQSKGLDWTGSPPIEVLQVSLLHDAVSHISALSVSKCAV